MFQRISLVAVLLTMTATSVVAADADLTVDYNDQDIAASSFASSKKLKLDKIEGRHPDGVRGSTLWSFPWPPAGSGAMQDRAQEELRSYACHASVFGVAELQDSKSFVGTDEMGIFTKLRFKLVDSWNVQPGSKAQTFDVLVEGGEVEHKGEIIRLSNPQAAYVKGRRYLVILGSENDKKIFVGTKKIFVGTKYLLEVSNGSIYAAPGWSPFRTGTSLIREKAMLQESLEQKGCE